MAAVPRVDVALHEAAGLRGHIFVPGVGSLSVCLGAGWARTTKRLVVIPHQMNAAQGININFMALWAAGADPLLAANDIVGRGETSRVPDGSAA